MLVYILIGIFGIAGIIMLLTYAQRDHAFIHSLIGMMSGSGALLLFHFYGDRLGYAPPVNLFNTAVSLIMGIPGAVMIEALNIWK